jgi:hypothetical protein
MPASYIETRNIVFHNGRSSSDRVFMNNQTEETRKTYEQNYQSCVTWLLLRHLSV